MPALLLHERTWPEVAEYLRYRQTIILPIGSTEQHAHHLPLGTDTLEAIRLAMDLSKKIGVMVAPPVWYGYAPHHMAFPGTVTISESVLAQFLKEIMGSMVQQGFNRILVLNGHWISNIAAIETAVSAIRLHTQALVVVVDPMRLAYTESQQLMDSPDGGMEHADEMETSYMLYFHPDLTHFDRIVPTSNEKDRNSNIQSCIDKDSDFSPLNANEFRKLYPSGRTGCGAEFASVSKGEKWLNLMIKKLEEIVQDMESHPTQAFISENNK